MNKIRALIVDDESLARDYLRSLISECNDVELVGEADNGEAALTALGELAPDLIFLDVQMPGLDGMEVIEEAGPENLPAIVFVTAFDQYAQKAFDVNAVDYLLKPFSRKRFEQALDKARRELNRGLGSDTTEKLHNLLDAYHSAKTGTPAPEGGWLNRIPVKLDKKVVIIPCESIDWIEAADDYVIIHAEGAKRLHSDTMYNLERSLDPQRFVRIHRSAIVNLDRVKELRSLSGNGYLVALTTGAELKLSRHRKGALEKALGGSL